MNKSSAWSVGTMIDRCDRELLESFILDGTHNLTMGTNLTVEFTVIGLTS